MATGLSMIFFWHKMTPQKGHRVARCFPILPFFDEQNGFAVAKERSDSVGSFFLRNSENIP
jgi:hypothetical protein